MIWQGGLLNIVINSKKWQNKLAETNKTFITLYITKWGKVCTNNNKRAQRALGRSPEENVKGQGEAIYRGPLMLSTKYW